MATPAKASIAIAAQSGQFLRTGVERVSVSKSSSSSGGQSMWGGRFASTPDAAMQAINASVDVDKRLWREDIEGSKAHAEMLAARGVISKEDNAAIQAGLDKIAAEIAAGTFVFSAEL